MTNICEVCDEERASLVINEIALCETCAGLLRDRVGPLPGEPVIAEVASHALKDIIPVADQELDEGDLPVPRKVIGLAPFNSIKDFANKIDRDKEK